MIQEHIEQAKHVVDGLAISTSVAAIMTWIPHLSAVVALVWFCLRAYGAFLDNKIKQKELDK